MAGSSPQDTPTETEVEVETKTPDVATSAESSPAETKSEVKPDMLSAVKAALEPKTEKTLDSGEQDPKAGEAVKAVTGEATPSDELTEEELAQLRPKTKKRIENLVQERNVRDGRIAELEPQAKQFETIMRFVEDAGLTKDEVNQGFDVMRSLKQNPIQAYERLKPIMDQLEQIVGVRLAPDLQEAVQLGQITEAHARELSTARSRSTVTQQQLQRRDQRDTTQREQQNFQTRVNEAAGKVTEWETTQAKTDPDWKLKLPRMQELVELEITRRQRQDRAYFPSTEEALQFSKDALTKVNAEYKQFAPRPRAVSPGHVDAAATRSSAKPKTMLEAARMGLQAANG